MILKNKNINKRILPGILALIGASIILLLTNRYGSGLTTDSVAYISAARNLAIGAGLLTYDGSALVLQPPLYPFLLSVTEKVFYIDPMISAGYLNAFLFGLIIYSSGLFLLRHLNSLILILLGTTAVLISYALVQVSLTTLSEPLFISLVLLFFHSFERYRVKQDLTSIVLLSLPVSLACLTRYTGIILILTGIICLLLVLKNNTNRYRHISIFTIISVLPLGLWIIRNYFISGTLLGQRAASSYMFTENIMFLLNTVLPWYLPVNDPGLYLFILFAIAIVLLFVGLNPKIKWNENSFNLIVPGIVFILLYSGFIVLSSTTTAYDRISNRLLSPIYIPSIFILFFIFDRIQSRLIKLYSPGLIIVLLTTGIIFMMRYPVMNTVYIVKEFIRQDGFGYAGKVWKENEIIQYLIQQKSKQERFIFYSNAPEAVYILSDIETQWSPAKTFYNSPQLVINKVGQKPTRYNEEKKILVWFDKIDRRFLFTIEELQKDRNITEVVRFNDGGIFTFSKR